jgi:AcrR family transcriptional regulator
MSRRKEEAFAERRQQIIDGALQVFSTKGFTQATNRDVAEAAGIHSPGLIYHYFKDKADLFRAVIERYAPPLQLVAHAEEMMALPPEEALTRFGLTYLSLMDDPKLSACVKLVVGEALRDPEIARMFGEFGPLRVWQLLADYLEQQMRCGILRQMSPALAARCFVGTLVLHILVRHVLRLPDALNEDPALLVKTEVDIFLHGLKADA